MGRSPCCEKKKNGLKRGPWTPEEDQKLIDYINKHGYGNWRTLPKNAGLERCGKSCRLRWTNYLRPDIKRGRFSFEEEETIIQLHSIMGNKWSAIAGRLPGRTDNEIKNYWNTHIRKRLLKMGIDPITHNPRLDLLDISSILTSSLYNVSHHHHQHNMNMSGLMMSDVHQQQQAFVNPEILKLAATLFTTSNQNTQENQTNMIGNQDFPIMIDQFNEFQDSMPLLPSLNQYDHLSSSHFVLDPFYSDFGSVLTTPSSSTTPLNSSSTSYTEDEKESYCSNYNNFMSTTTTSDQIPDYSFDVNGFLQFQETENNWDRVI